MSMLDDNVLYTFTQSERALFAEVYLPKKVVYQGTVFKVLRLGYNAKRVKRYLYEKAEYLLKELKMYQNIFNPYQYDEENSGRNLANPPFPTIQEAEQRIEMYASCFKGWSMYEVDGVWISDIYDSNGVLIEADKVYEERTQIVRVMFRLPSAYTQEAIDAECFDVLRSMLYWSISSQGSLAGHELWDVQREELFIAHHKPWTEKKLAFAKKYFAPVAREVKKWLDDCALFIFGYLVRQFAANVIIKKEEEQEIWVTSFFNLTVNVVQRTKQQVQP